MTMSKVPLWQLNVYSFYFCITVITFRSPRHLGIVNFKSSSNLYLRGWCWCSTAERFRDFRTSSSSLYSSSHKRWLSPSGSASWCFASAFWFWRWFAILALAISNCNWRCSFSSCACWRRSATYTKKAMNIEVSTSKWSV